MSKEKLELRTGLEYDFLLEPQKGSPHELLKEFIENYDRVKEKYGNSF
jgi:hypothetical protein